MTRPLPLRLQSSVTRLGAALITLGLLACIQLQAHADQGEANAAYSIGLWGDLPYSPVQEAVGLPNLLADMNAQKLTFTVHDDGRGYEQEATAWGAGLTGIQDRIDSVAGRIEIGAQPGAGTTASGRVPWPPRAG